MATAPTDGHPCCFSLAGERKLCWMINTRCNLRCPHCGVFDNEFVTEHEPVRGHEDIDAVLGFIAEQAIDKVIISGGEPTLSSYLTQILRQLREAGVEASLSTNATTLTAKRLGRLLDAGLRKATVSLDGATAVTNDAIRGAGSYARALDGIKRLVQADIQVTIGAFLHPGLETEIDRLAESCLELGLRRLCIFRPVPRGRSVSDGRRGLADRELLGLTRSARADGLIVSIHTPTCDDSCPSGEEIFGAIGGRAFPHCVYKPAENRRLAFELVA